MCANKGKTKRQNGPMRGFSIRRKGCCVYVTKKRCFDSENNFPRHTTNHTLSSSFSSSFPSPLSSSSSSSSMSTSSGKGIFWPKSLIAGSLISCIFWGDRIEKWEMAASWLLGLGCDCVAKCQWKHDE